MGNWLTEDRQVMNFFRRGFVELYTTSHSSAPRVASFSDQWCAQLNEEDIRGLEELVSSEEIKCALWSMKP